MKKTLPLLPTQCGQSVSPVSPLFSGRMRLTLPDFFGRDLTLPDNPEAWDVFGVGHDALVLGLGPSRLADLPVAREHARVYWLDAPEMAGRMRKAHAAHGLAEEPSGLAENVGCVNGEVSGAADGTGSGSYRSITPDEAVALAPSCRIFFYKYNHRLAPDFWGPLLGRIDAACACAHLGAATRQKTVISAKCAADSGGQPQGGVILPGTHAQLLHQELLAALPAAGLGPVVEVLPDWSKAPHRNTADTASAFARVAALVEEQRPALFLSVNLRGLDAEGRIFHLCAALNVTVAVWCVDNPWHLLSGLRLPWWRKAALFVTDPTFIPGLKAAGAQRVFHLPLATPAHAWRDVLPQEAVHDGPLFVGRSAFPGRDNFFAAARVPEDALAEAESMLAQIWASGTAKPETGPETAPRVELETGQGLAASRPEYHWWCKRLNVQLWPGQAARSAGLGAENCSRANRARLVMAALAENVRVVGDNGWRELVPALEAGANLLPPVDYYTVLPELYRRAEAVLDAGSLLLPGGLNQRHFDVWAAGGLLLSDAGAGLELFPAELTSPILLGSPAEVASRLRMFRTQREFGQRLRANWREHLRAEHGYEHRLHRLRALLEL